MKKNGATVTFDKMFHGVATVGERGQIVIPAEVRKKYGMDKGDKLLIFAHPFKEGIMIFPMGEMENFMREMVAGLTQIQEQLKSDEDVPATAAKRSVNRKSR